jgi:hypothetical protein
MDNVKMTRRFDCPQCGKQLQVRPGLVGKKVACPRCSAQLRFEAAGDDQLLSVVVVPPPNPDLYPPGSTPSAPATPARPPEATTAGGSPPSSTAESQTARFIQRDANATRVKLGADGQLPDLTLSTQEKRVDTVDEAGSSRSWLLIAVLCVSVLSSILILVIEEPTASETAGKAHARRQLEEIFASWDLSNDSAREIRDLLAHALRAYNRGDYEQEKQYYRQTMDLLNREDAPKYGGYTGDDRKLEEVLGELLQ